MTAVVLIAFFFNMGKTVGFFFGGEYLHVVATFIMYNTVLGVGYIFTIITTVISTLLSLL